MNHKQCHKENWSLCDLLQETDFDIGINKDLISFSQAIENNESDKWIDVVNEELKFMEYNKV